MGIRYMHQQNRLLHPNQHLNVAILYNKHTLILKYGPSGILAIQAFRRWLPPKPKKISLSSHPTHHLALVQTIHLLVSK